MMAFCYSNEESATCLHDRICYCNLESFFKFIQQSEKTLMNSKEELKNLSSSSLLIDFFLQLEITILKFLKRAVQMFAECSSAPPSDLPRQVFPLKAYNKHPFYQPKSNSQLFSLRSRSISDRLSSNGATYSPLIVPSRI